jgi:protein-tyrosine-phosphatase
MSGAGESHAPTPADPPLRVLTVCTHNRTRSVMMAAMLKLMLGERLGSDRVVVTSAGFGPAGIPAIEDAVDAMSRRHLDVSAHRSQSVTADVLADVDVVLTAERDHVVKVAALSPSMFRVTMTLPEFLQLAVADPFGGADDIPGWLSGLTSQRTAGHYLRDDIDEIADPTGSPARAFEAAVVVLEQQCVEASGLLARAST